MSESPTGLLTTPLNTLHLELGAKMVSFAGYSMPVQYPAGILTEHLHTRRDASLFDVSHMGQVEIGGSGAARWLETLVPGDIVGLGPERMRYSVFTNDAGGIIDDLMIARLAEDRFLLVVNASRKQTDIDHLQHHRAPDVDVHVLGDRALLALQGPKSAQSLAILAPDVRAMPFMSARTLSVGGTVCLVSRSGYTGEDGYEISAPADQAEGLARKILALPGVMPAGLGARDSLRLEAGLCLYGEDIDATTTPVEAGLSWVIGKRRRADGGFPGYEVIKRELDHGPSRMRVGIRPTDRTPARAHTPILSLDGTELGEVTSGGFGPSENGPVAMGYVPAAYSRPNIELRLMVRGRTIDARTVDLPFIAHRYYKS